MLKPGDFVRYLGHTKTCQGRDCENLDFPFLINKIMQVISTQMDREHPGLMVEYGGNNYGFLESHVLRVGNPIEEADLRYQAGVLEGLRQAAQIAEKGCVCVAKDWRIGCCSVKVSEQIRSAISKGMG